MEKFNFVLKKIKKEKQNEGPSEQDGEHLYVYRHGGDPCRGLQSTSHSR